MPDTSSKINHPRAKRHYTQSSSFVMALFFTILCALAALCLGYFINYFAKGHFVQSTEAVLDSEIRAIQSLPAGAPLPSIENQIFIPLNDQGLPDTIAPDIKVLSEGIIIFDIPEQQKRYAAKIHSYDDGRQILVGYDITRIAKDFRFMQMIGFASIVFVILIVGAAYIISIFVVRETNKIATTAHNIINTGDLSRRLEVGSNWDDLGHMAQVLNMLLDRIEQLMQGVRQVSDNIAHDLRTPLTRMRNHIDALPEGNSKDELLNEADHLMHTFNALLRISRIESEKKRSHFRAVNIKELLGDVVEFYGPLAEDKNITLKTDLSEASKSGDRDLLFQAFANLLDNAIKFTPNNGTITIALSRKEDAAQIIIADSGLGVSESDQAKIFNRFFRTEASRSTKGTGLGLSLVAAIVDLHGGTITANNNNPGLKIITII